MRPDAVLTERLGGTSESVPVRQLMPPSSDTSTLLSNCSFQKSVAVSAAGDDHILRPSLPEGER